MPYVPTNSALAHVFLAKKLLAATKTWCKLFTDGETAADQIHGHERRTLDRSQSYAIIIREDGWQRIRDARPSQFFKQSGSIEIGFYLRPPAEWEGQLLETDQDQLFWADDVVSTVITEMESLTDTGEAAPESSLNLTHLGFVSDTIDEAPYIISAEELAETDGTDPYRPGFENYRYVFMCVVLEVQ